MTNAAPTNLQRRLTSRHIHKKKEKQKAVGRKQRKKRRIAIPARSRGNVLSDTSVLHYE